jgi:hypothetical protein
MRNGAKLAMVAAAMLLLTLLGGALWLSGSTVGPQPQAKSLDVTAKLAAP